MPVRAHLSNWTQGQHKRKDPGVLTSGKKVTFSEKRKIFNFANSHPAIPDQLRSHLLGSALIFLPNRNKIMVLSRFFDSSRVTKKYTLLS